LCFSYEGKNIKLDSFQIVEMTSPPTPTDSCDQMDNSSGFWHEVQDSAGKVLYRRMGQNPVQFSAEVRGDDPGKSLSWQDVKEPKGSFFLLVPEIDKADCVVLCSSPMDEKQVRAKAEEIAGVDLKSAIYGKGEE